MKERQVMVMLLKEGEDDHIRGFILNKSYTMGLFGRLSTGRHNRHTSIDNIPKGYPPKHRRKFRKIINEMKRPAEQLIIVFPSTGERHVCANLDQVERGLELCNRYRQSVGLPPLDKQFREIINRS